MKRPIWAYWKRYLKKISCLKKVILNRKSLGKILVNVNERNQLNHEYDYLKKEKNANLKGRKNKIKNGKT